MTLDLTIFDDHQEQLALITAAVARAYYGNVLNPRIDTAALSEAYGICFALCPNYRLIVRDLPGFEYYKEKYKDLNLIVAEITSLPIDSKPPFGGCHSAVTQEPDTIMSLTSTTNIQNI